MKRGSFVISILVIFLISSCKKDETKHLVIPAIQNYLHLSHTRTDSNPYMDSIVETIDYSKFDMLWLGGDLALLSSEDDETMMHIDSIFDVGSENTLWALGNHDYTDLDRVQFFTKRPPYYSYFKDNITYVVLDTQDTISSILGLQKMFLDNIMDTIQESSHLIILTHKLVWMYGNADLEPIIDSVSNGEFGDCSYCVNPNNFNSEIYPSLLEVKQRGIQVVCIAGDIGMWTKYFEYENHDGIHFLASGISANTAGNKVLQFKYDITNKHLSWEFNLLSSLVETNNND